MLTSIDDDLLLRNFLANLREDNLLFVGGSALANAHELSFLTTRSLKNLVCDNFSEISVARDDRRFKRVRTPN
jgi:hypothetical protein